MTHVAVTLAGLLGVKGISQSRLAELTGIDRPTLSRYCNGVLRPTPDKLGIICAHISTDLGPRIELLIAHLRDEAKEAENSGIKAEDIIIQARSASPQEEIVVPIQLRDTFAGLLRQAEKPESSDLRELLKHLANMITEADESHGNLMVAEPPSGMDVVDRAIEQAALHKQAEAETSSTTRRRSGKKR